MRVAPIVFLGDSITVGWATWHAALFQAQDFVPAGAGGETSRQCRLRLSQVLTQTHARGLHLLCGINDIAGNEGAVSDGDIQDNIAAMASEARDAGAAIWIGSVLPAKSVPWRPEIDPRPRIASLNEWIRAFTARNQLGFLDYHSLLADEDGGLSEKFSYDGLHLSEAGYLAMEPMMLAALRPAT